MKGCAGACVFLAGIACGERQPAPSVVLDLDGDTVVLAPGAVVVDLGVGGGSAGDFSPDSAVARPGDVLRIRALDAGPHALAFDAGRSDSTTIVFLESTDQLRAMPFLEPEASWVVSLDRAPTGLYVVQCLTHGQRAMIRVQASETGRRR